MAASAYLTGAVIGALFFGWLTDRLGRKKLFTITVLIYALATIASGLAWDFWSFAVFRAITGAGIGGEYAAVNATIQELIPARRRGFTDLVINGSFWLGAALGAVGALIVLNPAIMNPEVGWRAAFVIGGVIGFIVLLLRRFIPESPRWLMTHGRPEEADRVVAEIERRIEAETGAPLPEVPPHQLLRLRSDVREWFGASVRALFHQYIRRTILGTALMASQAFCYNAVLFTYALILTRFYGIPSGQVGWFMLPFALGNFAGPLLLGRLFDTLGRKPMITATYALAGIAMAATGFLFAAGVLNAVQQTCAWTAIFFVASAAASSAYLTVGESFPARGPGRGDLALLRIRHRGRRHRRSRAVRRPDRDRLPDRDPVGLSAGRGAHGDRGGLRGRAWSGCRTPLAGRRGAASFVGASATRARAARLPSTALP